MKRITLFAAIAAGGFLTAAAVVWQTSRGDEPVTATQDLPYAPFASAVVGSGITETARGNVAIATNVPGVVRHVFVRVGDAVQAGAELFVIDDRDAAARLDVAQAAVAQAQASLDAPRHRLGYLQRLQSLGGDVISRDSVTAARDSATAAQATVSAARAGERQARVELERLTVHAPVAARVLQVNTREGQFADNVPGAPPLMLLGDDRRMYLRVNIDENDAWRVRAQASAVAVVRGAGGLKIPLKFEYIEPYVTARPGLTGQITERADLRVLQVLYSFESAGLPVYLGQQMDAFIEAAPTPARSRSVPAPR